MDEIGAPVVPDAAAAQLPRGVAQHRGPDVGQSHVDRAALHVEAALGHTVAPAPTLTTASGLVFAGDMDGNVIYAAPSTFLLDGKQQLVIPAGSGLFAFALPADGR